MSAFGNPGALLHKWEVAGEYHRARADEYLSAKIGRLSRNKAKSIILAGDFRRGNAELKPSHVLRAGEEVHLWRMPPKEETLDVSSVKIIYEDADWLVVDKPPNLAVHPTARDLYNTLTGWLKQYDPKGGIHPCHRLDRETSGILVCAKNKKSQSSLKVQFQEGLVEKTYLAIVRGHLKAEAMIDAPLALQGSRGLVHIRMIVDPVDGVLAQTFVRPVCYDAENDRTLMSCSPKTGRQHQIRAHLAHHGYPIVGDKLYAMGDEFFDAYTRKDLGERIFELEHHRHALHAHRLSFAFNGAQVEFVSPLPSELSGLMDVATAY